MDSGKSKIEDKVSDDQKFILKGGQNERLLGLLEGTLA
jgi:hypothetical protein